MDEVDRVVKIAGLKVSCTVVFVSLPELLMSKNEEPEARGGAQGRGCKSPSIHEQKT